MTGIEFFLPLLQEAIKIYLRNNLQNNSLNCNENSLDYVNDTNRNADMPFLLPIEDLFTITNCGTCVTGRIDRGIVKVGDSVEIIGVNKSFHDVITKIESSRKLIEKAHIGDKIGILLKYAKKSDIQRGMVVAKPDSIKNHRIFLAAIYICTENEIGEHISILPENKVIFYLRTTPVGGKISFLDDRINLVSGEKAIVKCELILDMAIERNLRFAIQNENKTIGVGIVSEIIL